MKKYDITVAYTGFDGRAFSVVWRDECAAVLQAVYTAAMKMEGFISIEITAIPEKKEGGAECKY